MKLPKISQHQAERVRDIADRINARTGEDLSYELAQLSDDERDHLLSLTRTGGRAAHLLPKRQPA